MHLGVLDSYGKARLCMGWSMRKFVNGSFCPIQSRSHLVPKKHTEAYLNYKLFDILAQAYY